MTLAMLKYVILALITAAGLAFTVKAYGLASEYSIEEKQSMIQVNGIVFDKSGRPRASAQIWDGVGYPPRNSVRTDSRGRFVLDSVKSDKRKWLVFSHAAGKMGLFAIPDDYADVPLQVVLDYNQGQAEGLVLDKAGRPLPQRDVIILMKTPKGEQFLLGPLKTRQDGRYSFLMPSKPGVKLQAQLVSKNTTEPKLQTTEITLSETDLFVEFPPLAPPGADIEKELQNRIVVSGAVIDEMGLPIPAVHVEAMYYHDSYYMNRETITDKAGRWRLPLPSQASNVTLRLLHPEFISYHFDPRGQREPSLAELQTGKCKLVMKRGLTITGKVSDRQGNPVENALVTAGSMYSFGPDQLVEDCTTARSAKDGSFSISGLPPEKIKMMVCAEDFSPRIVDVDMPKQAGPVAVSLSPGRTYNGQTVDSLGNPVESVQVHHCKWESGVESRMLSLKATTDANGNFTIPDIPGEGTVRFIFSKRDDEWQHFGKQMPDDLSKIDRIVMAKAPVFAGKVVDAETNEPVKHIDVTPGTKFARIEDKIHWYFHYNSPASVSADGSFNVRWTGFIVEYPFESGAYLKIQSPGYLPAVLGPVQPGDEQKPSVIRLVKAEPITGVVIDDSNNPVAEAQLAFVCAGERAYVKNGKFDFQDFTDQPEITSESDTHGRFRLEPIDKQGIILVVAPAGWAQLDSNDFIAGSTIRLSRWSRIEAMIHPSLVSASTPEVSVLMARYDYERTSPVVFWGFEEVISTPQRMVFDYLPAFTVRVGRVIRGELCDAEIIDVKPGKTYTVTIGQANRIVKGKILLPDANRPYDVDFTDFRRVRAACWRIDPNDTSKQTGEKTDNFFWFYRDTGKPCEKSMTLQKRFIPQIDEQGNFTFDYLPPGRYDFVVNIHDPLPPNSCGRGLLSAVAVTEFTVPDGNNHKPVIIPDLKARLVDSGPPALSGIEGQTE